MTYTEDLEHQVETLTDIIAKQQEIIDKDEYFECLWHNEAFRSQTAVTRAQTIQITKTIEHMVNFVCEVITNRVEFSHYNRHNNDLVYLTIIRNSFIYFESSYVLCMITLNINGERWKFEYPIHFCDQYYDFCDLFDIRMKNESKYIH